jgi:hypothetical protein
MNNHYVESASENINISGVIEVLRASEQHESAVLMAGPALTVHHPS